MNWRYVIDAMQLMKLLIFIESIWPLFVSGISPRYSTWFVHGGLSKNRAKQYVYEGIIFFYKTTIVCIYGSTWNSSHTTLLLGFLKSRQSHRLNRTVLVNGMIIKQDYEISNIIVIFYFFTFLSSSFAWLEKCIFFKNQNDFEQNIFL